MTRSLKYDIPGPDRRIRAEDVLDRGWSGVFAPDVREPLPLVVDVGYGRGEFLLDLATRHPDRAFVGIEVSFKRSLKMARRLARSELRNVRLLEAPAEQVVRDLLPPGSVATFWLNFPDPWPKKRHHRRRLVQPRFVRELARRLVRGGILHVATDHVGYAEAIDEALAGEDLLANAYAPDRYREEEPERTPTAYELEWRAEGRSFHFFAYARRVRDARASGPAVDADARPAA